jgi:hypothetical protein
VGCDEEGRERATAGDDGTGQGEAGNHERLLERAATECGRQPMNAGLVNGRAAMRRPLRAGAAMERAGIQADDGQTFTSGSRRR